MADSGDGSVRRPIKHFATRYDPMLSHAFVGSRKQLQHNQAFSTVNIKCNYERAIFAGWLLGIAIQRSRFASGLIYRIKRAGFPTEATLESYDGSRNPTTITREPFLELAIGEFIRRKENAAEGQVLLFVGHVDHRRVRFRQIGAAGSA